MSALESKRPMSVAPALALAGLLALVGCGGGRKDASGSSAQIASGTVPVALAHLQSATFATPTELSGSLTAVRSVTVGAISAGRIVSLDVAVGDHVSAGEVLAQVDTTGYSAGLTQAQAGASAASANESASVSSLQASAAAIEAARAQVAAAQSRLALARVTAQRMASLYALGAISHQQDDETQAGLAAAQAGLAQAQAGLLGAKNAYEASRSQTQAAAASAEQARAGVAVAAVPLRDATLTAPFDGVVTSKFVDPGAVVGAGSPVVTLQNTQDLELDVAVPDDDVASLVPGAPLAVRVDAIGGKLVPARVRAVVPSENPALRSATVKIALAGRAGLLPGMYARVSVEGGAHQGWGVPLAALVNRAGQSGIFVVRDGKASFVPVQPGAVGPKLVEVDGVSGAATEVAVSNLERLSDGSAVAAAP
jgi:multidrug efflux pump subunit AcrA (membrane-fusion protein)